MFNTLKTTQNDAKTLSIAHELCLQTGDNYNAWAIAYAAKTFAVQRLALAMLSTSEIRNTLETRLERTIKIW